MKPLNVTCPNCQQTIEAPEELLGQNVDCPGCGEPFLLSTPQLSPSIKRDRPVSALGLKILVLVLAVLVVLLAVWSLITILPSKEEPVHSIRALLYQDIALSSRYRKPELRIQYAERIKDLDLSRCPEDFRRAFAAHVAAWGEDDAEDIENTYKAVQEVALRYGVEPIREESPEEKLAGANELVGQRMQAEGIFSTKVGSFVCEDFLTSTGFGHGESIGQCWFSVEDIADAQGSRNLRKVDVDIVAFADNSVIYSQTLYTTTNDNGVSIAQVSIRDDVKVPVQIRVRKHKE